MEFDHETNRTILTLVSHSQPSFILLQNVRSKRPSANCRQKRVEVFTKDRLYRHCKNEGTICCQSSSDGFRPATERWYCFGNPLSVGRINTHIEIFKKMYALAQLKDKSLDRINPADGLRLKDKRRSDEKQDVFSIDDLTKMFIDSPEYGEDKYRNAHSFWLPLLGLFTGARLEELCQLFLSDVVTRDGVWCIDINETDAPDLKSVKSSERRIETKQFFVSYHFLIRIFISFHRM